MNVSIEHDIPFAREACRDSRLEAVVLASWGEWVFLFVKDNEWSIAQPGGVTNLGKISKQEARRQLMEDFS